VFACLGARSSGFRASWRRGRCLFLKAAPSPGVTLCSGGSDHWQLVPWYSSWSSVGGGIVPTGGPARYMSSVWRTLEPSRKCVATAMSIWRAVATRCIILLFIYALSFAWYAIVHLSPIGFARLSRRYSWACCGRERAFVMARSRMIPAWRGWSVSR
jgi:hypothetical protein